MLLKRLPFKKNIICLTIISSLLLLSKITLEALRIVIVLSRIIRRAWLVFQSDNLAAVSTRFDLKRNWELLYKLYIIYGLYSYDFSGHRHELYRPGFVFTPISSIQRALSMTLYFLSVIFSYYL